MKIKSIGYHLSVIPLFGVLLLEPYLLMASAFTQAQPKFKYGTAEVQEGKSESFFSDWDLCTDNSNNTAVDKQSLKTGQSYFQGYMDKHGRIIALRYYDLNWIHRWTKRFYYSRNGQHRYSYFSAGGQRVNFRKQEALVRKRHAQEQGTSKEKVRRILGEPVIIQIDKSGMERWRYFDGIEQHWYIFNAKGELDNRIFKE